MAYQCGNCGPGCSSYSTHNYDGKSQEYHSLGPSEPKTKYDDINKYDNNPAKDYHTVEKEEKKEEEEKQRTIEDEIKKEAQKEEKQDEFKTTSQHIRHELQMHKNTKEIKANKVNTIEEAIKKAIKNQKEVIKVG